MYYDTFFHLSDAMKALADENTPEPIALLVIARRALDAACSSVAHVPDPTIVAIYRRLGTISRDVIVSRDQLDEALHLRSKPRLAKEATVTAKLHAGVESAAKAAATKRKTRAKTPGVEQFHVGQLVDVRGNNTDRVEYTGRVIRLSTRLHVESLDPNEAATRSWAYDAADVRRGRITAHVHKFTSAMFDKAPEPTECCIGCERSARELEIVP